MREKIPSFVSLDWPRLSPEESQRRARAFRESMDRRRSVRHFSSEPLAPGVLEEAIACAAHAPSGANQQPWTFVVVTDPALEARLREALGRPENEKAFAVLPVGYPAEGAKVPDIAKKSLDEVLVRR